MFHNSNFKTMKTNVQITASKKEFKNGQNGYEVKVEGMDGKLDCKMNFTNPLKAMRYMFLLSKRLELQIDSIQLAALSLAYQRAKEAEQKAVEDAAKAANELGEAEEQSEPAPAAEPVEPIATEPTLSSLSLMILRRSTPMLFSSSVAVISTNHTEKMLKIALGFSASR